MCMGSQQLRSRRRAIFRPRLVSRVLIPCRVTVSRNQRPFLEGCLSVFLVIADNTLPSFYALSVTASRASSSELETLCGCGCSSSGWWSGCWSTDLASMVFCRGVSGLSLSQGTSTTQHHRSHIPLGHRAQVVLNPCTYMCLIRRRISHSNLIISGGLCWRG